MMVSPTFSKQERIVSRRLIETLFGGGDSHSVTAYPLKAVFMLHGRQTGEQPAQILISVPKKRFKHAVDRNRIKRQVREAYRHHKQLLWDTVPEDRQMLVAFIWMSDNHLETTEVEKRVASLLQRIAKRL